MPYLLSSRRFRVTNFELVRPDGSIDVAADLAGLAVVNAFIKPIPAGHSKYINLGTPCSSFSILSLFFNKGSRSRERPQCDASIGKARHGSMLLEHSVGCFWTPFQFVVVSYP